MKEKIAIKRNTKRNYKSVSKMKVSELVVFLKNNYKNDFNTIYRTMNYLLYSYELEAIYYTLHLKKYSKHSDIKTWQNKFINILNRNR